MSERILVVDDNSVSAEILRTCLKGLGADTVICTSGGDCLELVARGDVSMVFTEVAATEISGLDILTSIRQKHDLLELPVIMVTSLKDDNTMAKAFGLGANDFLHKPINCLTAVSKIYNHILALELYKKSLQRKGCEIVNSMIATYNHEINNALSIAFAEIHLAGMENDFPALTRIKGALEMVCTVTKKIKDLGKCDIEQVSYLFGEKRIRIDSEH